MCYDCELIGSGDPEAARPDIFAIERGREQLQIGWHSCETVFPPRDSFAQHLRVKLLHRAARPNDLERRVEREESLEHVLLTPETEVSLYELLRVVEWGEDVVEMDEYAGRQPGQNAEQLIQNVAIHRYDMAGIDEEDIACLERKEQFEGRILHFSRNQLREARETLLEIRSRVRFNGDQLTRKSFGCVLAHGCRVDERRVAAADLDHALGLALADEGVRDFGINALEETVVEMELGPMSVDGDGFLGETTFRDIGEKLSVQEVDLLLESKIKPRTRAGCAPVLFVQ